jgi:zinc protease
MFLPPLDLDVPFQKFVLDNGLEVVVHEDHSDPVLSVQVVYHVGSAREASGRSGFAHLFEHMLFQGSEHVGDDQHFKLIQGAGGTLNGTTNLDRTSYFESLPSNQLELALWLEADRMGFLLPAMTQAKLDNQREVVKNERRQNYENRPYGRLPELVLAELFGAEHPYGHPTIGSLDDLDRASLEDVAGFFRRWYGPNNATLVVAGDVDPQVVRARVEHFFGPLPRGPLVDRPAPEPVHLQATRVAILEDDVSQPQLTLVWPTVPMGSPDEAAVDLLTALLAGSKSAWLERALVTHEELASQVSASHQSGERAGRLEISLRPTPGTSLSTLQGRVDALLEELATAGIDPGHLARIQSRNAGRRLRQLESVAARADVLAHGNCFFSDPGHWREEFEREQAVRAGDVQSALGRYLLGAARLVVSVVPRGKAELAAASPVGRDGDLARDRRASVERERVPGPGSKGALRVPAVWHAELANGVRVTGSPYAKLPLTRISLALSGGRLAQSERGAGLASLVAALLTEGVRGGDGAALAEALDALGATLDAQAGEDEISLTLSVPDEHLARAVDLLGALLLEPTLGAGDFARLKKRRLVAIQTRDDRIRDVANDVFAGLLWEASDPRALPALGTAAGIARLTLEDAREFWRAHLDPAGARLCYVGALDAAAVTDLFAALIDRWPRVDATQARAARTSPQRSGVAVFLVDKPGAAQSELRIGHPGWARRDPDFYRRSAANYVLGGSFTSRINLNLREDKGYTYGARSEVDGGLQAGAFSMSAGVHTAVTAAAVKEALAELGRFGKGVTPEELEYVRAALGQGLERAFETTAARLGMLETIAKYGEPDDFPAQRKAWLEALTQTELDGLARDLVHLDGLVVLVVGDRAKILPGLAELGIGTIVELRSDGARL